MLGSTLVDSVALGGLESITVVPEGGAGGVDQRPGTYWLGDHREPYREAGLSGRLVVHPRCGDDVSLARLPDSPGCESGPWASLLGGGAALAVVAVGVGLWYPRHRRTAREAD